MSARRQDFLERFDWIRTALMFEPRGHDIMSGAILYPPCRDDCDTGILYIEVIGLPADVRPRHDRLGDLRARAGPGQPAAPRARSGSTRRPASWSPTMSATGASSSGCASPTSRAISRCPRCRSTVRSSASWWSTSPTAAISMRSSSRSRTMPGSTACRPATSSASARSCARRLNDQLEVVHPDDPTIRGVSHIQWTGPARDARAHGRNAVFYGARAIDRSPCGTGTSARMAQLAARGELGVGDDVRAREHHRQPVRGPGRGHGAGRRASGDRAERGRLGAPDRAQHDLRRPARSLRPRLPAELAKRYRCVHATRLSRSVQDPPMQADQQIGFVGLGAMGAGMAANLLEAGFSVTGCDRREAAVEALVAAGGKAAASPGRSGRARPAAVRHGGQRRPGRGRAVRPRMARSKPWRRAARWSCAARCRQLSCAIWASASPSAASICSMRR